MIRKFIHGNNRNYTSNASYDGYSDRRLIFVTDVTCVNYGLRTTFHSSSFRSAFCRNKFFENFAFVLLSFTQRTLLLYKNFVVIYLFDKMGKRDQCAFNETCNFFLFGLDNIGVQPVYCRTHKV